MLFFLLVTRGVATAKVGAGPVDGPPGQGRTPLAREQSRVGCAGEDSSQRKV